MMVEPKRRWWRRIQWIDVVLAVVVLLFLTAEMWMPHFSPE
jgi:hypothetical protein